MPTTQQVIVNSKMKINIYGMDVYANYGVKGILEQMLDKLYEHAVINGITELPDVWVMCNEYVSDISFFLQHQREGKGFIIIGSQRHRAILMNVLREEMHFIESTRGMKHVEKYLREYFFYSSEVIARQQLRVRNIANLISMHEGNVVFPMLEGKNISSISKSNNISIKRVSLYKRRLMARLGVRTTQELYVVVKSCEKLKIINLLSEGCCSVKES